MQVLTPKEVHIKAAQLRHSRWTVDECNGCDAKIGYIFSGDKVYYDSGCRCDGSPTPPVEVSWTTVAQDLNSRLTNGYAAETKQFWKL